jgi:hypothetical protein
MRYLTKTDVVEVAGLTDKEVRTLCNIGVPSEGGEGHGNHRKFTVMMTVGFAVAAKLRQLDRRYTMDYTAKVVTAFGSLTERKLQKLFDEGRTHFVNYITGAGTPVLDRKKYDWIDVKGTYDEILAKIEEIEQRFSNFVGGRPRGLANKQSS